MANSRKLIAEIRKLGDPKIAEHSAGFFKTGPGEYGEGDRFIGVRVPVIRQQLKKYRNDINVQLAIELLHSEWHEIRLFAALSLLDQFQRAKQDSLRKTIVTQYLAHRQYVNNWDIVDGSAPGICGGWYYDRDRSRLHRLIRARSLWDRRIAMMSTLFFIRKHDFADTYHFAEQLLHDKEDLIHKASGWMLREAGKRDSKLLSEFLNRHAAAMPRTMLRYAIEKLPQTRRKHYMAAAGSD